MNKLCLITIMAFMLSACSIPSNPSLSFGKKCSLSKGQITYSYVWLYDKETGLPASVEQCEALPKKD